MAAHNKGVPWDKSRKRDGLPPGIHRKNRFISWLLCNHANTTHIRNIYGDEINLRASNSKVYRSLWQCKDCGKLIKKEELKGD